MIDILCLLGILVGVGLIILSRRLDDPDSSNMSFIAGLVVGILGIVCLTVSLITIVGPGERAVQVRFGTILNETLDEGFHLKNIFASVEKCDVRLRETTMDMKDATAIEALTSDKLSIFIDATIWWQINQKDLIKIYREISSDYDMVDDIVVFSSIRTSMRDAVVKFSFDDLITKREELSRVIDENLIKLTSDKGVTIQKILIRNIIPTDKNVINSIGRKLQQQQELQAKEYEYQKALKDKEIRIVNAESLAQSQEIIQQKLTPMYIQFEAIQMMRTLAGSPNTTFVFVPMSQNSGIPSVLDVGKMVTRTTTKPVEKK